MVTDQIISKGALIVGFLITLLGGNARVFQAEEEVYLFSYFTGNGEDGLHIAYSEDGFHFKPLAGF